MSTFEKKLSIVFAGLACCAVIFTGAFLVLDNNTDYTVDNLKGNVEESGTFVLGASYYNPQTKSLIYEVNEGEFVKSVSAENEIDNATINKVLLYSKEGKNPIVEESLEEQTEEDNAGSVEDETQEMSSDNPSNDSHTDGWEESTDEMEKVPDGTGEPEIDDGAMVFVNDEGLTEEEKQELEEEVSSMEEAGVEVIR